MNRRDFIKLVGGLITIPIVAFTKEIPETDFTMKSVPINCTTKKLGNIPVIYTNYIRGNPGEDTTITVIKNRFNPIKKENRYD